MTVAAQDSPRWCGECHDFGDHHTDRHVGPTCNGICVYATELLDHAPVGLVAYPHPECELHGDPELLRKDG